MTSSNYATWLTHLTVIKRQYQGQPGRVGMAQLARFGGLWMRRALTRRGAAAVMATRRVTTRAALAVCERGDQGDPRRAGVAQFARLGGQRMGRGFAGARTRPIVTTGAVARLARHGAVIK